MDAGVSISWAASMWSPVGHSKNWPRNPELVLGSTPERGTGVGPKKAINHDIEGSQLLTCSHTVIEVSWLKAVVFRILDHDLPQEVQKRQQSRQRQK
jgi:hypothetical protein